MAKKLQQGTIEQIDKTILSSFDLLVLSNLEDYMIALLNASNVIGWFGRCEAANKLDYMLDLSKELNILQSKQNFGQYNYKH